MTWYMNFCAPFMPNDPTINFHRSFQVSLLVVYTIVYALVHIYYLYCGPLPLSQREEPSTPLPYPATGRRQQEEESPSDNSNLEDNKSISLKSEEHANESCIELKKTATTWNHNS